MYCDDKAFSSVWLFADDLMFHLINWISYSCLAPAADRSRIFSAFLFVSIKDNWFSVDSNLLENKRQKMKGLIINVWHFQKKQSIPIINDESMKTLNKSCVNNSSMPQSFSYSTLSVVLPAMTGVAHLTYRVVVKVCLPPDPTRHCVRLTCWHHVVDRVGAECHFCLCGHPHGPWLTVSRCVPSVGQKSIGALHAALIWSGFRGIIKKPVCCTHKTMMTNAV